jgi:2'-5' RNA ligase
MDEHTQDVMIALRPVTTDWAKVANPHLTLVYAGQKIDLKPSDFNALSKTVAGIAMDFSEVQLYTNGLDQFGEEGEKVDVIKLLATPSLMQMRQRVAQWNASQWPFTPHVTIGPVGTFQMGMEIPPAIAFDRIWLSWGEDEVNFWLKPYTTPMVNPRRY